MGESAQLGVLLAERLLVARFADDMPTHLDSAAEQSFADERRGLGESLAIAPGGDGETTWPVSSRLSGGHVVGSNGITCT